MGQAMASIRENPRAFRKNDYGLENALAKWVRNRWPEKTIAHVAHHFGLSEAVAAKVVYATASKNVLNQLLHHKRGGFGLFLELVCDATGSTLEQYIAGKAEEARRERIEWEARERRLALLQARVSDPGVLDRIGPDPAGRRRPQDEAVGGRGDAAPLELKTFESQGALTSPSSRPYGDRR